MTQAPQTPTRVAHSVEASTLAKLNRGPPLVIKGQNASRVCATSREGNRNSALEGRRVKDCAPSTSGTDSGPTLRRWPEAPRLQTLRRETETHFRRIGGQGRGSSGWGGQRSDLVTKVFREGPAQGSPGRRVREAAPRQRDFGERSSSIRKAFKCLGSEWPLPRSLGASIIITRVSSKEGRRPPRPSAAPGGPLPGSTPPERSRSGRAEDVGGGTR